MRKIVPLAYLIFLFYYCYIFHEKSLCKLWDAKVTTPPIRGVGVKGVKKIDVNARILMPEM